MNINVNQFIRLVIQVIPTVLSSTDIILLLNINHKILIKKTPNFNIYISNYQLNCRSLPLFDEVLRERFCL